MTGDPRILIVEDQQGLADAYSTVLSTEYTVETATSGTQALEMMSERFDIVILDRRMPGMSGDEVLETITERDYDPQVAMLTAVEPDVDIVDMPLDSYVTKPIDNTELLDLVSVLVERASYREVVQQFCALAAKQLALENADCETTSAYESVRSDVAQLEHDYSEELADLPAEIDPFERGY